MEEKDFDRYFRTGLAELEAAAFKICKRKIKIVLASNAAKSAVKKESPSAAKTAVRESKP